MMKGSSVQTIKLPLKPQLRRCLISRKIWSSKQLELNIEVSDQAKKPVCRVMLQLQIERLGPDGAARH